MTFARRQARMGVLPLCAIAAVGCSTPAAHPSQAGNRDPIKDSAGLQPPASPLFVTTVGPAADAEQAEFNIRKNEGRIFVQLDAWEIQVPYGSVSNDPRFWKHIDEDHVDLRAHEMLQLNGVRYGIAPTSDWSYFKSLMDRQGAKTLPPKTLQPSRKGLLEMPLRTGVEFQNIFFVRSKDEGLDPLGRSYERCDNILSVSCEPTPRRPGEAHI